MSPESQEVSEDAPHPPNLFMQRLMHEVPSLQDALSLYNTTKKDHHYVGAALHAAEAGLSIVANTALPLAYPLVNQVGGWGTLDQWACHGLDRVEEAAPIITQPTKEMMNKTHALVLKTIAGQREDTLHPIPLSTLSDALTLRALNTARVVAGTQAGMAVVGTAHRLLDKANTIVDTILPVEKWDHVVLDHDGRGGTFGVRVVVLKDKCRRRMKAKISDSLHVTANQPLKPDDLDITLGHLIELARRLMIDWQTNLSQQIYASRIFQHTKTCCTVGLEWMNVILSSFQARAGTVWALVTDRAGRVQNILFSGPAGPMLKGGVGMASDAGKMGMEMTKNGVDIVTAVMRYNILLMRSTILVVDEMVRGKVKEVKHCSVDVMGRVAKRGSSVVIGGVCATKNAVTSTAQASLTTVAIIFGTAQHVATGVVSMGGSIGRQGVNVVRNIWGANTRILLRICTTSQKFLPGSKYFPYLNSLIGVPYIWINDASCHDTQQQHQLQHPQAPSTTPISSQGTQETPLVLKQCSLPPTTTSTVVKPVEDLQSLLLDTYHVPPRIYYKLYFVGKL
ncbi:hypothetical protein O3P69_003139 [Scylla paramamosain]|uniref:Uncharacterized protein n=2 Tax=Scylla paramamosain TaxID=85552 RepID=A0AAW0UJC6_SCYPA